MTVTGFVYVCRVKKRGEGGGGGEATHTRRGFGRQEKENGR